MYALSHWSVVGDKFDTPDFWITDDIGNWATSPMRSPPSSTEVGHAQDIFIKVIDNAYVSSI